MASIEFIKSIDWNYSRCSCVASHERQLRQRGFEREALQSAVRIAATVHAVARVLESLAGEQPAKAAA
jgi:lipoyl-dependent peroxiredoxin subunit D